MVSHASPTTEPDAPDLAACEAEFQSLVSSDQPLLRTLAANNLSLTEIFRLIASLPFHENFEALREIQAAQVHLLHQVATFDAIRALQDVCRSNATATERRLAATQILSLKLSQDAINEPDPSPRRSSRKARTTRDAEMHVSTENPPTDAPHQSPDSHHAAAHSDPAPSAPASHHNSHPPHPRRPFIENPEAASPHNHAAASSTPQPAHDLTSPDDPDAAIQSAARHFAQAIGIPSPFDLTHDLSPQQAPAHTAHPDLARSPPPHD